MKKALTVILLGAIQIFIFLAIKIAIAVYAVKKALAIANKKRGFNSFELK